MFHSHFLYIDLSVFFNLNSCFLANSKLITNPIAPLSNNASTVTPSYISTLSKPILTVTSLSHFSLFRSQQNVLFITLESIIYPLLLRLNQGVSSLTSHLNFPVHFFLQSSSVCCSYCHCILVFFPSQFCSLLPCSYNFLLNAQILHNYNSSYYSYPSP